ncbi:CarD family transcriptional regulator [Sporanaerobium hydrogeniformans]|uniref:CarD family transcriptional regulator n=1 Tax=Sporanaerobium hydrogeniformans TaxID=3072179 RepID=A0AC61D7X3_9FIRM|nr:CarD family transcriptional regulator [Sporanaerobium hydrogeniformans]PHV69327.1 CarD family transcriptional regulator [Sporanaerobium hydrogeniformans]
MFQAGEYIIYGSSGVCRIEVIGRLDAAGMPNDRDYYTLRPCYMQGSTVFTPIDNQKIIMRPIMSKEEALKLIDEMKEIECLWITDEKRREIEYKEALRKCDGRELVKIIKTIYMRKQSRLAAGKKVTASDEKYFNLAEEQLYGEIAISLAMDKEAVKEFVIRRVKQLEQL